MNQCRRNWHLWAGFLLCLLAFASYPLVFARFPPTRDVPWVNLLIFGTGLAFLVVGLARAFGQSHLYRGKVAGPILSTISLLAVAVFCFIVFYRTRQLPAPSGLIRIGLKAPDFVLPDTKGTPVSLSSLLSQPLSSSQVPPKGVLLVFYRGYW